MNQRTLSLVSRQRTHVKVLAFQLFIFSCICCGVRGLLLNSASKFFAKVSSLRCSTPTQHLCPRPPSQSWDLESPLRLRHRLGLRHQGSVSRTPYLLREVGLLVGLRDVSCLSSRRGAGEPHWRPWARTPTGTSPLHFLKRDRCGGNTKTDWVDAATKAGRE